MEYYEPMVQDNEGYWEIIIAEEPPEMGKRFYLRKDNSLPKDVAARPKRVVYIDKCEPP